MKYIYILAAFTICSFSNYTALAMEQEQKENINKYDALIPTPGTLDKQLGDWHKRWRTIEANLAGCEDLDKENWLNQLEKNQKTYLETIVTYKLVHYIKKGETDKLNKLRNTCADFNISIDREQHINMRNHFLWKHTDATEALEKKLIATAQRYQKDIDATREKLEDLRTRQEREITQTYQDTAPEILKLKTNDSEEYEIIQSLPRQENEIIFFDSLPDDNTDKALIKKISDNTSRDIVFPILRRNILEHNVAKSDEYNFLNHTEETEEYKILQKFYAILFAHTLTELKEIDVNATEVFLKTLKTLDAHISKETARYIVENLPRNEHPKKNTILDLLGIEINSEGEGKKEEEQ